MRLLWEVLQPSNSLFLLFALGFLCRLAGRHRTGNWMMSLAAAVFAVIMALPVPGLLIATLETRFPAPELPAKVDGIITLGGALSSKGTERWRRPQANEHAERLTEAMVLSRRYPKATLLVSGGHWDPNDRMSEAGIARRLLADLGQPMEHAVFEDRSRTTWENGVLSRELVRPQPGQTWVLVTSAFHMPRVVGVFRRLGWDVIPYPVDYYGYGTVSWSFDSVGDRLVQTDIAAREWMALILYHLMGRTPDWFPGPA